MDITLVHPSKGHQALNYLNENSLGVKNNSCFVYTNNSILAKQPIYEIFIGKYVTVKKLQLKDIEILYSLTHGTSYYEQVWNYLPYGPFTSCENMKTFYNGYLTASDKLIFCIYDNNTNKPIGITCFEDIKTNMASLEIGSVIYAKDFQKSKANTETIFLLATYCFEVLNFRRIAWRCNNENQASKNAAIRLGFEFEGIFYNHMIVKGRNRDTAWFGLIDKRWPTTSANYKKWLYLSQIQEKISLKQMNSVVKAHSLVELKNIQIEPSDIKEPTKLKAKL